MEGIEFQVLGPAQVVRGRTAHQVRSVQLQRLAASLILADGATVDDATLTDRLWGAEPPPSARSGLQVAVNRLRRLVEPERGPRDAPVVLRREGTGYLLDPDLLELDARRVGELVDLGERSLPHHPERALGHLADALSRWRGEAWAALEDDMWLTGERARIHELRLRAEDLEVDALLLLGRYGEAAVRARGAVRDVPYRERRWVQLITALYGDSRQRDALAAYEEVRDLLAEDLGLQPGPDLVRTQRDVLDQAPLVEPVRPARAAASPTRSRTLVAASVSPVGRDAETELVTSTLRTNRLVTLTGLGGIGKTTLALHVATSTPDAPDGFCLVALDRVKDSDAVDRELVEALGVTVEDGSDPVAEVVAHLADRRMLVVLDNCEHVIDAAATVARTLLGAGPGIRVLATSRLPLDLPEEVVVGVAPLAVPGPDDDPADAPAVRLLVERMGVGRVDPADPEHLAALARLSRQVDGIPLALELAAARCRVLSPADLSAVLAERLDVLEVDQRGRPDRHQSVAACLDLSFELVDERALQVLGWIALLPAPASPDLLGALSDGDLLRALEHLASASLLRTGPDGGDVEVLDLVRRRARPSDGSARSSALDELAHRCTRFAEHHRAALRIGPQGAALAAFGDQHDNLLAVVELLEDAGRGAEACRLAASLDRYWYLVPRGGAPRLLLERLADRAGAEGRMLDRARLALALAEATKGADAGIPIHHDALAAAAPVLEAAGEVGHAVDAYSLLAIGHGWLGDVETMHLNALAARGLLDRMDGHPERGWLLTVAGYADAMATGLSGDVPAALQQLLRTRDDVAALGDLAFAARLTLYAALVAELAGDEDLRRRELQRSVELVDQGAVTGAENKTRLVVAELALDDCDPGAADALLAAAEASDRRNDRLGVAWCHRELGRLAFEDGDPDRAAMWFRSALPVLARTDRSAFLLGLVEAAPLLTAVGSPDAADALLAAAATEAPGSWHGIPTWDDRRLTGMIEGIAPADEPVPDDDALLAIALRGLSATNRRGAEGRSAGVQ